MFDFCELPIHVRAVFTEKNCSYVNLQFSSKTANSRVGSILRLNLKLKSESEAERLCHTVHSQLGLSEIIFSVFLKS